ncbi:hypothetical protein lbkm_2175 [Lachnospiraceae bacterium KM106-2]|nr:hypothetical protein lbkm_2175 [Lachnospiraceae bacterium KM106-2]
MLTLNDTQALASEVVEILTKEAKIQSISVGNYEKIHYPKYLPFFRFIVKKFGVKDFGNLMIMQTKAMGGMRLLTMSFTPNLGTDIPYLLIDCMSVGKKRAVFIEYYDHTEKKQVPISLLKIARQYEYLPDYKETSAWYVSLRTKYSLIKGNTREEEPELIKMLLKTVKAYGKLSQNVSGDISENLNKLQTFRKRMIKEGNPSSKILTRVLGEKGAKSFYCNIIMPIKEDEKGVGIR